MNKISAYIPNLSFKQTIDYIDNIKKVILNWFINEGYKIIEIDLPLSSSLDSKINDDCKMIRSIDFDSSSDYLIYEIINAYDNLIRYIYYYYEPENDYALFSKYTFIDRDKSYNQLFKDTLIYNFELPFKESDRLPSKNKKNNFLDSTLKQIWTNIYHFASLNENTQANLLEEFDSISSQKLQLLNPLSSFNKGLHKYIKLKKIAAVFFQEKLFNDYYNGNFLQSYDADNTVVLFAWFDQFGGFSELITMTIRPNWEIFKKQNNINSLEKENEYNNDFFNLIKNGLKGVSLSIKIHFDNLIIYLLSKKSGLEVPSKLNEFCLDEIFRLKRGSSK